MNTTTNPTFVLETGKQALLVNFLQKEIPAALPKLNDSTKPLWGGMTPQQMIEHLNNVVVTGTIVTEKEPVPPTKGQTDARNFIIHSDEPLPRGLQNPTFQFGMPPNTNRTLDEAKAQLAKSIEMFFRVRSNKPTAIAFNAFLGDLNFDEQLVFHGKHFRHHFTQFNLL